MTNVAKAIKPLFDKFIDFFDVFDLSFVVAGATFIAAIAWADMTPGLDRLLNIRGGASSDGSVPTLGSIVLVLAAYIAGMTCFAVGRWFRRLIGRNKRRSILHELERHGVISKLDGGCWQRAPDTPHIQWLDRYLDCDSKELNREAALYVRMWAEVRQREELQASFSLLRRYWVSAATLDGLFVATLTWAGVLLGTGGYIPGVITGIGAIFSLREAHRYEAFQHEELAATVLLLHDNNPPDTGAEPTG